MIRCARIPCCIASVALLCPQDTEDRLCLFCGFLFFFLRLRGDPLVLPFGTIPANQHDDRAKELIQRHGDPEAVNAHMALNRQQMSAAQADDQVGENRPQRGSFDIA